VHFCSIIAWKNDYCITGRLLLTGVPVLRPGPAELLSSSSAVWCITTARYSKHDLKYNILEVFYIKITNRTEWQHISKLFDLIISTLDDGQLDRNMKSHACNVKRRRRWSMNINMDKVAKWRRGVRTPSYAIFVQCNRIRQSRKMAARSENTKLWYICTVQQDTAVYQFHVWFPWRLSKQENFPSYTNYIVIYSSLNVICR
jgi:hypothetical protein